mmetsp:Transcript_40861/g.102902  ORF Transcript_40861/g.102902 Transcript_40861/m.102902 type:complete len:360 (+) Transcript_40861:1037-2116(+)
MTLRDETTTRVHHPSTTVGHITSIDQFACFTGATETKRLIGDQLIARETIVELDHLNVSRSDTSLLQGSLCSTSTHTGLASTDHRHTAAFERILAIGGHCHADDLNRLRLETVTVHELFVAQDRCTGSVAGRAALKTSERVVDGRRAEHLLETEVLAELSVRVQLGVLVVLHRDLGKVFLLGGVLFHVFTTSVAKHLRSNWSRSKLTSLEHGHHVLIHRIGSIVILVLQRATFHLFEAESHHTVGHTAFHQLFGHEKRRGTSRTVVVHVVDRNTSQTQAIHRTLATGRVTINVADNCMFNGRVRDASVSQRFLASLLRHVGVVPIALPRFLKLGHTHAHYKHSVRLRRHPRNTHSNEGD